jgi:hypothetical protein
MESIAILQGVRRIVTVKTPGFSLHNPQILQILHFVQVQIDTQVDDSMDV